MSNKPRKRRRTGPLTPDEEDAYNDYVRHFRRNVLPKMNDSTFVMSLIPDRSGVDVKFATELGMAIMLDKPIFAVVPPGRAVPRGLRAVAAKVVELDVDIDTTDGQAVVAEQISKFVADLPEEP